MQSCYRRQLLTMRISNLKTSPNGLAVLPGHASIAKRCQEEKGGYVQYGHHNDASPESILIARLGPILRE